MLKDVKIQVVITTNVEELEVTKRLTRQSFVNKGLVISQPMSLNVDYNHLIDKTDS